MRLARRRCQLTPGVGCFMLPVMLTTLDLAADVLSSARALAEQSHQSIDTVISELARRGLSPASPAFQLPGEYGKSTDKRMTLTASNV